MRVMLNIGRGRLPGLDGIRAISIVGVIVLHCSETPGFPRLDALGIFVRNGGLGVEMFFVLSGFLITSLLLREEIQFGSFPQTHGGKIAHALPRRMMIHRGILGLRRNPHAAARSLLLKVHFV
jgi:hypothetical protein